MPAKLSLLAALVVAATASALAAEAVAVTCYVVLDRSDNVTYRDVYPPVDLSDQGRAERDAMRRRGEFLFFMESEQCPRIEYFTGTAGNVGLQLEQTLAPSQAPREASPAAQPATPRAPRKPPAKKS